MPSPCGNIALSSPKSTDPRCEMNGSMENCIYQTFLRLRGNSECRSLGATSASLFPAGLNAFFGALVQFDRYKL